MYLLQAALSFTIEDLINPDHKKKAVFMSYFISTVQLILSGF